MEKIKAILEKMDNLFLEGRMWGVLKKDTKILRGPVTGGSRKGTPTIIKKGTPVEVTIGSGGSPFYVYIIDGQWEGIEISTRVSASDVDYRNMKKLHKKYSPSYPLTKDELDYVKRTFK